MKNMHRFDLILLEQSIHLHEICHKKKLCEVNTEKKHCNSIMHTIMPKNGKQFQYIYLLLTFGITCILIIIYLWNEYSVILFDGINFNIVDFIMFFHLFR